jgi:GNAT superfamily N-acetyltransferase
MPIREAGPQDAGIIHQLICEHAEMYDRRAEVACTVDDVSRHILGPDAVARGLVIELDDGTGTVAGQAVWIPTFSTWAGRPGIWLDDLYIRPPYRGRGLGSATLRHLRAMTDGRLEWEVRAGNDKAQALYRRMGATEIGEWTRMRWLAETGD